jgi:hypothetical protein
MAAIGLRGGVAALQRGQRRGGEEIARPAAAAETEHPAVPVFRKPVHPHDLRTLDRPKLRRHFAERGRAAGRIRGHGARAADLDLVAEQPGPRELLAFGRAQAAADQHSGGCSREAAHGAFFEIHRDPPFFFCPRLSPRCGKRATL